MERIFKTFAFLLPGSYAFLWPRALNKVALQKVALQKVALQKRALQKVALQKVALQKMTLLAYYDVMLV